jgi:hypothetical protein
MEPPRKVSPPRLCPGDSRGPGRRGRRDRVHQEGHAVGGAQRQYTGTTGTIDNCQLGAFLAYASPRGRALIDRELYLPRSWTGDRDRCAAAGVPDEVEFATKPEQGLAMLAGVNDAGVQTGWVTRTRPTGRIAAPRLADRPRSAVRAGHPQRRPADLPRRAATRGEGARRAGRAGIVAATLGRNGRPRRTALRPDRAHPRPDQQEPAAGLWALTAGPPPDRTRGGQGA